MAITVADATITKIVIGAVIGLVGAAMALVRWIIGRQVATIEENRHRIEVLERCKVERADLEGMLRTVRADTSTIADAIRAHEVAAREALEKYTNRADARGTAIHARIDALASEQREFSRSVSEAIGGLKARIPRE